MGKVIKAIFDQLGGNEVTTESRYQYDYGMVLKFGGAVTLPQAYEVHFALDKTGDAVTQIGGADGVTVPDSMFTSGSPIYAWVYLHDGETDGYTQYTAIIPVIKRAAPSDQEPTPVQQSAIDQAIAALGVAVEQTAADVETTTEKAAEAQASAEAAAASAAEAAETAENVEENVTAARAAKAAAEAARDRAVQAETSANQSKTAAATSEANAAASATAASASAAAALTSEENANGAMMSAYSDANRADTAADTATSAKNDAVSAKNQAQSAKTSAETAATTATQKASAAATSADTATTKATAAANSATAAAGSATAAANSATEAATTAQGISEHLDQIDENTDAIDALKEDLSTLNSEGTVPTSEQMLSDNYTEDSVPYHFRKTASDNADREELEIVGGSVAWNQLIVNGNFADGITGWSANNGGGTVSASNGELTYTATTADEVGAGGNCFTYSTGRCVAGHKYLYDCEVFIPSSNASLNSVKVGIRGNVAKIISTIETWQKATGVSAPTASNNIFIAVDGSPTAVGDVFKLRNVNVFDLTLMLGSTIADHIYSLEQATAGAGVALFRSLFPKDYYAYDAGSMQSVSGLSEHRTVGFNQWDGTYTANTWLSATDGTTAAQSGYNLTDFIRVLPNTEYHVTGSGSGRLLFYDSEKVALSGQAWASNSSERILTTPAGASYVRFTITTVNLSGFMFNLSDPAKNGTYEPYDGHSYPLDDSLTLRGIPTLADGKIKWDGDVYSPSGKVTRRFGIVDLGTLNWEYNTASTTLGAYFYAYKSGIKSQGVPYNNAINAICTNYPVVKRVASDFVDKTLCGDGTDTTIIQIQIKNSAYTDAATFKAAMSGVYLVYELATPTTEQADPYVSPQICHYDGTEEFVSTGIVPVGHVTKYPDNMRAKLDGLPWNFANLIAPTESGFKATRNYTTGALLIVNNVLYKATANIANGATITPNTNVTATTLAEIIAALS